MTEAKQAFWGLIELMGHAKIAGLVSEVEMGGAKLLRVDVPDMPEQPPQGWRDASPAIPAYTRFVGGAAIYAITSMSEDACRALIASLRIDPVYGVGMHHIEGAVGEAPKQIPIGQLSQGIQDLAMAKMRNYLRDMENSPTLGLVPPHAGLRKAQYESDEDPF